MICSIPFNLSIIPLESWLADNVIKELAMIKNGAEISRRLLDVSMAHLPFKPTEHQSKLMETLCRFVIGHGQRDAYILNGYAGTGKSSVIGAVIKGMNEMKLRMVLLAPTGRAAKVASQFAGVKGSTIHKRIYRAASPNPTESHYFVARNNETNTIFFVDEASMITHGKESGRSVLKNLIDYVYSGSGCAIVFIGDTAQLPPPGESNSPAMMPGVLRQMGINPYGTTLDVPKRQQEGSGILVNATEVRHALSTVSGMSDEQRNQINPSGLLTLAYPDFTYIENIDFADSLSTSWAQVGREETLIITRSNRRANNCNRDVRAQVLYADEPLMRGERLVVTKNDYYWGKVNKCRDFIANGETAIVEWIGATETAFGFHFADAEMRLPSDNSLIGCKVLLETLTCDGPGLGRMEMEQLYNEVLRAQTGDDALSNQRNAAANEYFNAIQVKYAYCVTGHKAQGGQWKHVYIDLTGIMPEMATSPEFFRWLYTSITRATERVFIIGSPWLTDRPDDF